MAQQLSVTLKTQDTLELTFTQAVVSCYQAAQGVLNDVALVAAEPTTLEDVILSDDGNLSPGGEALYWLQNLTDMPLQFWSSGPGQSKRTVPFAFEPSDLGKLCLDASCCHLTARARRQLAILYLVCSHCKHLPCSHKLRRSAQTLWRSSKSM